ncbi:hypothetical protein Glove_99g145 [Diversispora epigaea]|uniref:C2H2-type domain-containing protein n=1 Tax=Diversispora epigaea TaxID=1348612 RepID=A0A397JEU8_9GLOM|nr:hypothetical protein Glove_99g145 [Diversispora epigaea]
MPSTILSFSHCSTCDKEYKNSKGLTRHKHYVQRYNQRRQELDEIPLNTIDEFKQIIVAEIHRKLTLSFKVCADPIPWNNNLQDQSVEEIDPLEKLLKLSIKKQKIKRRPRFL